MVMLNDLDRFHLVIDVIDRVPGLGAAGAPAAPGDGRRAAARTAPTRASTATTRPRSATGRWPGGDAGMRVLVVNAGSSSLKLRAARRRTTSCSADARPGAAATRALGAALADARPGRRGRPPGRARRRALPGAGARRRRRRRGARGADRRWRRCTSRRRSPRIDAVARALPGVPAVACFDTAFHADAAGRGRAPTRCPGAWRERSALRRYGFHGLSHAYASPRAAAGRRGPARHLPPRRRARRWPPCAAGGRSTRRWASLRWRAW